MSANNESSQPVHDENPITGHEEPAVDGPDSEEPLPAVGNVYKELFEMDIVEEVGLSRACCYLD